MQVSPPLSQSGTTTKASWLGAAGICLLFIALRWNSYDAPLIRDEGEYAYSAQLLRQGLPPYQYSFVQKPPMVIYTYALANLLAPHVFWFPRVLAYLFVSLATILLGWIVRVEFGAGLALPAMWLFTAMVVLPKIVEFTANTEMFMLLPLMGVIALYVAAHVSLPVGSALKHLRGSNLATWGLAGFLSAATLLYKYTALPVLAMIWVTWSIRHWRAVRNVGSLCRCWFFSLLGASAATAAALAFFLIHDGGKHFWECTVVFNRFYAASSTFGLLRLWSCLKILWADWWLLFLLPWILLIKSRRKVWFWIAMFSVAWVSTGASSYSQYYIIVMPFWALVAAVAINRLGSWISARFSWPQSWLRRLITAVVVAFVCLPHLSSIRHSKEQFVAEMMRGYPFPESATVARRVAQLSSALDYVFVAGSEPQILYYSKRLSPTRFVIMYPLTIPTPLAQGYQREVIADLERHPPGVIVTVEDSTSWLVKENSPVEFAGYLEKLLRTRYDGVGGYVPGAQRGRWQEPMSREDAQKASLLLFRRRSEQPSK